VPLHFALQRSVLAPQAQPRYFPLAAPVVDALERRVAGSDEVELIAAGHPSSPHRHAYVVIVLGASHDLDPQYASALIDLVRREMRDDDIRVEVRCLRQLWQRRSD
jgi:hypothetical protein